MVPFKVKLNPGQSIFEQVCFAATKAILAGELKAGEAAVKFEDEKLLAYCEVLPLLRLPERRLQFERRQAGFEGFVRYDRLVGQRLRVGDAAQRQRPPRNDRDQKSIIIQEASPPFGERNEREAKKCRAGNP